MSYSLLIASGAAEEALMLAKLINLACPGLDISIVHSGLEAFSFLREHTPSAIMLDFILPDISGTDFLGIVRQSKRLSGMPLLVMSGTYTEPSDRADVLLHGATGFVQKPYASLNSEKWGIAFCNELAYQLKTSVEDLKKHSGHESEKLILKTDAGNSGKKIADKKKLSANITKSGKDSSYKISKSLKPNRKRKKI
ncbi:MAG: response regulator [Elusimicrobiales bacterium]|nr:response regulator [Elusimicrobiales bacterium]